MFFKGVILGILFVNFNIVTSRVIKTTSDEPKTSSIPASRPTKNDNSLKNNADQGIMNQFHQMYRTEVQQKDTDLHHLLVLKQQYIARNYIEEFEIDLALDFVPDWSKVDEWSSTARQGIEIRRQKWEYIFEKHSDIPQVQSLASELAKSGLNQSTFCREIAEAYFILSHNSYVYSKGPAPRVNEIVHHPKMDKSLKIFMHVLPNSEFKFNDTEELIKIPKSVYHKLLRKDAQMALLKKHHENANAKNQKESHRHHHNHSGGDDKDNHHSETTRQSTDSGTSAQNTTFASSTVADPDSILNSSNSSSSDDTDDSSSDSDADSDDDSDDSDDVISDNGDDTSDDDSDDTADDSDDTSDDSDNSWDSDDTSSWSD